MKSSVSQMGVALFIAFTLFGRSATAHDMVPIKSQSQAVVIQHATVHTVSNGVLKNQDVRFEQGRITAIGTALPTEGAEVIDASDKHLYPGLIALDTSIGLVEVSMMRASNDSYEVGESNPQLLAVSAFNPDSEIIPTVRVNGITHAQVVPKGKAFAGQSSLVALDSWTIEDALVPAPKRFHLYWPSIRRLAQDKEKRDEQLKGYQEELSAIQTSLEQGYRYKLASDAKRIEKIDIRWQAMLPLYQGQATLFVHANNSEQIEQAVNMTRPYGFKLVIVGGYDAWRVAGQLNEIGAGVIYTNTFNLPMRNDEPVDMNFKIPSLLKAANIPFALGFSGNWDVRNLPFAAGQASAYGLSKEEALKSITLDAAKLLGIADMGAIKVGFKANLVLSKGELLDPLTSRVEAVFIDGRQIDLNNRQQQLYQKYLKR